VDPVDKATRVANYVNNRVYEVGTIAHSRGVSEPRQLRGFHARVVTADGCIPSSAGRCGFSRIITRLWLAECG